MLELCWFQISINAEVHRHLKVVYADNIFAALNMPLLDKTNRHGP